MKEGEFLLEKRKIQKVGESTLSVSLPKEWLNHTGVKVGDPVYLHMEKDGSLSISSQNPSEREELPSEYQINCDFVKELNLLERLIVGSYILGRDTIRVFSSDRIQGEQIEQVRNIARRLVGLSIVEESKNEIILQCTVEPSKFKIYSLMKRMYVIVSTMLSEALESLLELNAGLAQDVIRREDEANNIYWLMTRLLLLGEKSEPVAHQFDSDDLPSMTDIRLISKSIERVADCSEGIAKIVLELEQQRDTIDKRELEKVSLKEDLTKDLFQKSVDSVFERDLNIANQAANLRLKLDEDLEDRTRNPAVPDFRAIAIMLAMIAENSATIASTAIDIEISKSDRYPPFS